MFVEMIKNNGINYLRLVQSRRVTNSKGVKTSVKKVVYNIGPLSRFDDGQPDYLKRLKQSFKDGNPLISELIPYVDKDYSEIVTISFPKGDPSCIGNPKYLAPCVLDGVFSALGLDDLFASIKHSSKIQYDLQGIVRLLTYGRILEPDSKIATMRQNDKYFFPLVKSSNDDNVYDALDMIYKNRKQIFRRMNTCISNTVGRNVTNIFYDVTNFFFEIENPDDDESDENGNVIKKGLRKMGVSKENRKQPIVQMGLFLDGNGIPISIEVFPGNTLDHLTLRTAMKNTVNMLNLERFILIADRGMYSGINMCHVLEQGDGYIVSKSIRKSKKSEREWILEQNGYTVLSPDFKYKSQITERVVKDENGNEKTIKEKSVVFWSRAYYERERHENKAFLDFMEKLKANPHGFRISVSQSKSLRKFLKKEVIDKASGEVLDGDKLISMIDEEKLTEFNDMMGYYQVVTSELDMDDTEVIDKYHGLTRIEDQFREMKGTLETRPIFVKTEEHMGAHLIVCFIALTMIRVMQNKVKSAFPSDESSDKKWSYKITGKQIANILSEWKADKLPGEFYRIQHTDIDALKMLLEAFEISFEPKLFSIGDLRKMKSSVKAF